MLAPVCEQPLLRLKQTDDFFAFRCSHTTFIRVVVHQVVLLVERITAVHSQKRRSFTLFWIELTLVRTLPLIECGLVQGYICLTIHHALVDLRLESLRKELGAFELYHEFRLVAYPE